MLTSTPETPETPEGIWFDTNSEQNNDPAKNNMTQSKIRRKSSFLHSVGVDPNSPAMKALEQLNKQPTKSILKK